MLSYQIINNKTNSHIIGLHGPPGIGKTTIIKDGLARILKRPFFFISLGGISDASYLEGHSYTYEGSKNGIIVEILKACKCMNPIIYFDELDKISKTAKGDEIANLLIHLTDESQNDTFKDKYFDTVAINLSQVTYIFSFNDLSKINPILRDRINVITMNDFNKSEKIRICNEFFIPKFLDEYKFKKEDLIFSDKILDYVYNNYNKSYTGLRGLKTILKSIVSKISMLKLTDCNQDIKKILQVSKYSIKFPLNINEKLVDMLLLDK
jgi:ATP-dependent Lon protease